MFICSTFDSTTTLVNGRGSMNCRWIDLFSIVLFSPFACSDCLHSIAWTPAKLIELHANYAQSGIRIYLATSTIPHCFCNQFLISTNVSVSSATILIFSLTQRNIDQTINQQVITGDRLIFKLPRTFTWAAIYSGLEKTRIFPLSLELNISNKSKNVCDAILRVVVSDSFPVMLLILYLTHSAWFLYVQRLFREQQAINELTNVCIESLFQVFYRIYYSLVNGIHS